MGSPLKQQRRGKGSPKFQAGRNGKGTAEHKNAEITGTVVDLVHDPARTAPVAKVEFEDGEVRNVLAPEGLQTGDEIEVGVSAPVEPGNVLPLGEIPEGVPINNIELQPNDGGKLVKSSGTYAFVVTHEADSVRVQLPSGEFKKMNTQCRATIGKVAAGGRKDKPFVKAGNASKAAKARGKQYPTVSAVAMNAVDHPFGGSAKPGQPKTVSKHASPGSKVGNIGAKRSGKQNND
ncbi:50S ribosomal protein L2 [Candidatus Nanohalobium constans]|uniref:50S ribosomal protein L2 n=1 Tax=Candidatus Nanohalobium constans TaxID=2565781 RepID=A0A5Q0UHC8_9ARCH|nr:50S ribosomal protein L2 [Candidatus Nanohalobium constans]QGA80986.1 50S ribosomal protein L2 [Candidatus Nanohalobium constans]